VKRAFDLALALVLLVAGSWLVLLALIAIKLDSRGPAFFRQVRIGRNRQPFKMIKLRTMSEGTASVPSHEVPKSAITAVGAWLRRTKIDELPQVWSVITGDMSFVGPRPCLPNQLELIAEREARGVFTVRPGITGPAQLAGIDMSTPQLLAEVDAGYVQNRSFARDLGILCRTFAGRGMGDAARVT
jgi:O-antigen biosynthesis protein WbqP